MTSSVLSKCRRIAIKRLLLAILFSLGYQYLFVITIPPSILLTVAPDRKVNLNESDADVVLNVTAMCSPVIPLQLLDSHLSHFPQIHTREWKTIWKGPGLSSIIAGFPQRQNQSTCFFFQTPQSKHFPHAMQQLYRCWSYWRLYPERSPVLVGPSQHRGFRPTVRPDFFTHMLQALQSSIELRVAAMDYSTLSELDTLMESLALQKGILSVRSTFEHGDGFALASSQDSVELRKALLGVVHSNDIDWQSGCPFVHDRHPRIAILNRDEHDSKRSFLNTIELARAITDSGLSATNTVPIVYFENATFTEQIQFFNNVDIVLSPHGAQLTSLPFMPSCGGVLEFFPRGYFMPFYFGSLARAAGLHYSALYVSENDNWENETSLATRTVQSRFRVRQSNLCPLVDDTIRVVRQMVDQWKDCCSGLSRS